MRNAGYDFFEDLVDCRKKADEMRALAEHSNEDSRQIFLRAAELYDECAVMIEKLRRLTSESL